MVSRILSPAEATALQTALNKAGAQLVVDGHFGELTKLALIRFQHAKGLDENGDPFDPLTLIALGISTPQPQRNTVMTAILGSIFHGLFGNLLNWQLVQGYIRSALVAAGGWVGLDGMVGADGSKAIIGAIMVILGVVFQALANNRKVQALEVVKAVDASPAVNLIPASQAANGKPLVVPAK